MLQNKILDLLFHLAKGVFGIFIAWQERNINVEEVVVESLLCSANPLISKSCLAAFASFLVLYILYITRGEKMRCCTRYFYSPLLALHTHTHPSSSSNRSIVVFSPFFITEAFLKCFFSASLSPLPIFKVLRCVHCVHAAACMPRLLLRLPFRILKLSPRKLSAALKGSRSGKLVWQIQLLVQSFVRKTTFSSLE